MYVFPSEETFTLLAPRRPLPLARSLALSTYVSFRLFSLHMFSSSSRFPLFLSTAPCRAGVPPLHEATRAESAPDASATHTNATTPLRQIVSLPSTCFSSDDASLPSWKRWASPRLRFIDLSPDLVSLSRSPVHPLHRREANEITPERYRAILRDGNVGRNGSSRSDRRQ